MSDLKQRIRDAIIRAWGDSDKRNEPMDDVIDRALKGFDLVDLRDIRVEPGPVEILPRPPAPRPRFLRLTWKGEPMSIRADHVATVFASDNSGATLVWLANNDGVWVDQTPAAILAALNAEVVDVAEVAKGEA